MAEAKTDYQKKRERERDIDAGKPVPKQRQPRMTDYQKRRAEQKRQEALGENSWSAGDNAWSSEHNNWTAEDAQIGPDSTSPVGGNVQEERLSVGDPVIVTAPNEFEGKTGEISEFSPSGKFVIVNLYNYGEHSMHLSDVEYNQYADEEMDEAVNPQRQQLGKMIDKYFGQIYDYGDDGLDYLDKNAPVWFDLFNDEYGGDIDNIVAMAPINLLKQGAMELKNVASDLGYGLEEGWSNKMVAQRTGQLPTPYSVYIKGREWKSFADDDHAEAVANKLRAKFKAEGRDPSVITIAPTDYDKGMDEALSRKDLLKQVGDKLNDPEFRKQPADSSKRWEKGDLYQGPGPDDYGYTGYQGHGMPRDNPKKKTKEAYTPAPVKPFRSPRGFNKQGTGLGNKLADLNRKELANIQQSKGTPVPAKEFARGVEKDLQKAMNPSKIQVKKNKGVAEGFIKDGANWNSVLHSLNVFSDVFVDPLTPEESDIAADPKWAELYDKVTNSEYVHEVYSKVVKLAKLGVKLNPDEVKTFNDLVWDGGNWESRGIDWLEDLYQQQLGAVMALLKQRDQGQNTTKSNHTIHEQGVAEVKADPTGSWIVYQDGKRPMKFKTHTGAKAYAAKNGGKVASSEFYADKIQGVKEAEGTPEGLPHLTKELLTHIVQQVGKEGAHAIIKSLEWGDGAAEELLALILKDLRSDLSDEEIAEHIGKVKGGYRLYSKHGSKNLGTFPTKAGAEKHEREVQYFKHAGESVEEEKQRLDPTCWSGYHKDGTQIKGGVRVNKCVKNESTNYWTKLQNERNTKLNSLVNELKESIKK